MGKRKSSKKAPTKTKAKPLDKVFRCLFCQHHGSVLCKMDRSSRIGRLDCKDCLQSFQAAITPLDEAVDLYSMWIDACEAVNVQEDAPAPRRQAQSSSRRAARGSDDEDEDEDDEPAPSRRPAARDADLDDDDDDEEELPDLPGTRPAASKSNGNSRSGAAGNDDGDEGDDQDADASIDRSAPVDMGYERQPVNAKMAALLEQRKGRAAQVADNSDEDE